VVSSVVDWLAVISSLETEAVETSDWAAVVCDNSEDFAGVANALSSGIMTRLLRVLVDTISSWVGVVPVDRPYEASMLDAAEDDGDFSVAVVEDWAKLEGVIPIDELKEE
jgi:hypothetical protein